jgi:peptide deformylase
MPARPLLLYPDPRLRQPAAHVEEFGPGVEALAADLGHTLSAVSAIGLTGPHIGVLRRVIVVRMEPGEALRTCVNPAVLWTSPEMTAHEEGSVGMPGIRERIKRPARVRVAYQDLTGERHEVEAAGFEAAVLQHEIDQVEGVFWIDRLSRLKRDRAVKRFGKLQRG